MPLPPMPARGHMRASSASAPPGVANGLSRASVVNAPQGTTPTTPDLNRATGTVSRPPAANNKGFSSSPVAMAAGGPVLGRSKSFLKTPDEFTGGRLPPKQTAPAKQDYGSKSGAAKRTGDKSLPAVKPRGK